MVEAQHSHHHPDYDQRIRALEEQVKKLEKEVRDLKQKLETHLESTGLIHFSSFTEYARRNLTQKGFVSYFDSPIWVEFPVGQEQPQGGGYQLNIGFVLLTKAGTELAPLSGAQPREGFVDFVKDRWKSFGLKTEAPPEEGATDQKAP